MEDERHVPAACSIGVIDVYQDKSWLILINLRHLHRECWIAVKLGAYRTNPQYDPFAARTSTEQSADPGSSW